MAVVISGDNTPQDVHAGRTVKWPFKVKPESSEVTFMFGISTGPDSDDAPEWSVALCDSTGEVWSNYLSRKECTVDTPGNAGTDFTLEVTCPNGARFGETVCVSVEAHSAGTVDSMSFEATATQSIMALKTQMDQERSVADSLASKASEGDRDIYAILCPIGLRGYVFVEGMNTDRMRDKTKDIRKARGFVSDRVTGMTGETEMKDIEQYLTPMSPVKGISVDDLVELVSGPFKGEKARVKNIDEVKEEITVELIEAMMPIPVTVKGDSVRVIEKEK